MQVAFNMRVRIPQLVFLNYNSPKKIFTSLF